MDSRKRVRLEVVVVDCGEEEISEHIRDRTSALGAVEFQCFSAGLLCLTR